MITIYTDPWAHEIRATQLMRYQALEKIIAFDLKLSAETKVYDCACSNNFFLGFLRTKSNFSMFGSDVRIDAIKDAELNYPNAKFAVSELPSVADFGQRFDAIFALEVLLYLDDTDYSLSLQNLMKHLKPSGILYISNPQESNQNIDHKNLIYKMHESYSVTIVERHIYLSGAIAFEKILLGILKIGYSLRLIRIEPDSGILETRRKISPNKALLIAFFLRPILPLVLKLLSSKAAMASVNRVLNFVKRLGPSHTVYIIKRAPSKN